MNIPTTTPGTLARVRTSTAAITRRIIAIGALALLVFGLSASAASAGADQSIHLRGGWVSFKDEGEILTAKDTRADGWSVEAFLSWSGRFPGATAVKDGSGADNVPNVKNLSFREGKDLFLTLCYTNDQGPDRKKCTRRQRAEA